MPTDSQGDQGLWKHVSGSLQTHYIFLIATQPSPSYKLLFRDTRPMTDILDRIDVSLEEIEEQLLAELRRIRHRQSDQRFANVDPGIKNTLSEVVAGLLHELRHSGDRTNLQLLSERHEVLFARIGVLQQLFDSVIPMSLLIEAHDGIELRRRQLEHRVAAHRKDKGTAASGERMAAFDRRPTPQQVDRNRMQVTLQEERQLQQSQAYLDNGIYSASRELAIIASLARGGTLDEPPEDEPRHGRAVFEARELSRRHPTVNKRPKVQQEPPPEEKPAPPKRDIAQTPEEIRRKLEARREQVGAGKATFAARDIEPAAPREFYGRKAAEEDDKKEDNKPRTGRAVFKARDLSERPVPKKG